MRLTTMRVYPFVAAAALLASCGGGATVPPPSTSAGIAPAAQLMPQSRQSHANITCGTDEDDCHKIRLVAPLDIAASPRGITLSLSSTKCAHARVRIDDGRLPLSPQIYTSPRAGFLPLTVSPMNDPCADRDRDRDALHPMVLVTPTPTPTQVTGNTNYYVVAIIQAADGSYTVQTLDGAAQETGTTLAFSTPVISRSVQGAYAFYLAKIRRDDKRHGHHGDD